MAFHPGVEASGEASTDRLDVVESVRPRLIDLASREDIDRLIDAALDELTPANVTTYLPILVERRVRVLIGQSARTVG